ncbi:MAG: carboxypeptidase-like regulatory domain-containing protein [Flavobacteriaceae bacterium]|nr:carboxypeptidase-like regulatory domain-containing protein [Flavobacteriaceae bacterium]
MITALALAFIGLFSVQKTQAQNINNTRNTPEKFQADFQQKTITVKGTVKENGMPLPGVSIHLTGTSLGTTTDFDGNFEFPKKLKKGDILVFNYIGFKTQKITIDTTTNPMYIDLNLGVNPLDKIVIVGKVATKKRYKSKQD